MSCSESGPVPRERRAVLTKWAGATLIVATTTLVAACASPRAPQQSGDAPDESWSGRFSVTWRPAEGVADERASGRFLLAENAGRSRLEVFSPFGQTIARAQASATGARLETADGRVFDAASAEALTEEVLGWRAPVSRLARWLRGQIGAPGTGPCDTSTQIAGTAAPDLCAAPVIDDGWAVVVERWSEQTPGGRPMPERLTLTWPAPDPPAQAHRVTIRLLIDRGEN